MATAALTDPKLRIVPLAQADLAGLDRLFDEQCEEWLSLLGWDYSGPSRLIREVAAQRELSGFAAMLGESTIGFCFYVVERARASIGDIYVSRRWRKTRADREMAAAILRKLDNLVRLRRIESQCVSVGNEGANALFASRGFDEFERHYMMISLASAGSWVHSTAAAKTRDIIIRQWEEADFAAATGIIHRSYRGEHDSRINSQYGSEEGCAELLSILTEHVWCGEFLPEVSRVAIDGVTGRQVAVLIASRISDDAGHIGQISVAPAYQGSGIGRMLISGALDRFQWVGLEHVSLAVTSANDSALHLYQTCGFSTVHKFNVFYKERKP
jgi:ribosomal protein S18 acetylase RimI-like enzyme